jgi:predicted ATPase
VEVKPEDANEGQSTYNSAMLKRIYIDNFRCFVNFEYKPERKQLLLGANGSGKSSLLEAIQLLQGFFRDDDRQSIEDAFWQGKTRWLDLPNQTFQVDAELEGRQYSYHLELNCTQRDLHLPPTVETLTVDGRLVKARRHDDYDSMFRAGATHEAKVFYDWMTEKLQCINIDPYAMEKPALLKGRPRLARNLSNIGDWYRYYCKSDTGGEGSIQLAASLQEVMDGFTSLDTMDSGSGCTELMVTLNRPADKVSFAFNELSEGQRCLIAIYMILHFLIEKDRTVFLDEPDNFISLREIQPWLLQAEAAADESRGQLILISHHPEILNMWAHEYGMRMFREDGGPVQIEKYKTDYDDLMQPAEVVARGWEND